PMRTLAPMVYGLDSPTRTVLCWFSRAVNSSRLTALTLPALRSASSLAATLPGASVNSPSSGGLSCGGKSTISTSTATPRGPRSNCASALATSGNTAGFPLMTRTLSSGRNPTSAWPANCLLSSPANSLPAPPLTGTTTVLLPSSALASFSWPDAPPATQQAIARENRIPLAHGRDMAVSLVG